jgi:hypothetical protein
MDGWMEGWKDGMSKNIKIGDYILYAKKIMKAEGKYIYPKER